jgi:hypothetical protein
MAANRLDPAEVSLPQQAKATLLQAIQPTEQGRNVRSAQAQAIERQIQALEHLNPTPAPTAAAQLLTGNWRTLYTTSRDLLRLGNTLPGVTTGEIYQCVRAEEGRVFNVAEIQGSGWLSAWLPRGIFAVAATFEVKSAQRIEVTFHQFVVGSQPLMNYQIDSFLTLLEHKPEQIPALKLSLTRREQRGWLDITYLDETLRIGRGSEGSLFVLQKV